MKQVFSRWVVLASLHGYLQGGLASGTDCDAVIVEYQPVVKICSGTTVTTTMIKTTTTQLSAESAKALYMDGRVHESGSDGAKYGYKSGHKKGGHGYESDSEESGYGHKSGSKSSGHGRKSGSKGSGHGEKSGSKGSGHGGKSGSKGAGHGGKSGSKGGGRGHVDPCFDWYTEPNFWGDFGFYNIRHYPLRIGVGDDDHD
ncbi:hypothetical protein RJ55_04309 [Drechmeria coniospora]|nr:hypothetical protein RJ55_04309 [Drechmeria coniospora]